VDLVSQRSCGCVIIQERVSGNAMKVRGGGKRFQIRFRIIQMLLFLHQYSRCHRWKYRNSWSRRIDYWLAKASTLSFIDLWVSRCHISLLGYGLTMSCLLEMIIILYNFMRSSLIEVLRHLVSVRYQFMIRYDTGTMNYWDNIWILWLIIDLRFLGRTIAHFV